MSSVKNVGAVGNTSRTDPPPKIINVAVPGAKPTREQVAEAVFRGYGFDKKKDAQFLKENFRGTDPVAHLARTLKYNPRSTTADGSGAYKTRVKLSAADHDTLKRLAAKRGAAATQGSDTPSQQQQASTAEARAVKSLTTYDYAAQTKERLQRQTAAPPKPENKEGVGAFFKSVVAGDFDANESWSATAGKVIGGLNPLADVRDIAAGVKHVAEGKQGAWVDLGTSALGAVPVVGDAGKALIRGGRKVAKEVATQSAEAVAKKGATEFVPLGGRAVGDASRRPFDPDAIGTPIRKLTTDTIKVTPRGIDFVERHLSRFDPDKANEVMIQRLRDIADGKIKPTQQDVNFYAHELRESVRYKQLGYPQGQPVGADAKRELWNNAHTATLEDYGIKENNKSLTENPLYHPDAAKHIPR